MPTKLKVNARGSVVLPKKLRRIFAVKSNDTLVAEATAYGILLKPAVEIYSDERIAEFEKNNNESLRSFFSDKRSLAHAK